MREPEFTLLVGMRGCGKTYQLRRAADYYAYSPASLCTCVHVVDRWGEMRRDPPDLDADQMAIVHDERGYHSWIADHDDHIPLCVLWQDNPSHAYRAAIETGNCVVIVDEAYDQAPAARAGTWKGDPQLMDIVLRGRHLVNADGKECCTALIMACQYPKSVHLYVYNNTKTVMCSKLVGEQGRDWVRGYCGKEGLARVDKLEKHDWAILYGPRPKWYVVGE